MNKLRVYTLTVSLLTFTFIQQSHAATIAPPLSEQVKQVERWFTGSFDNAQQVASNSSVPLVSLSDCRVQLAGINSADETQNLYLQEKSPGFERDRLYSFSQGNSAVTLSIRSFVNQGLLNGICNLPEPERIVNYDNVVPISCNLDLTREPSRYVGTNAPSGCPTSTGGKAVTNIAIQDGSISVLDQIFDATGNLISNTPIEYRKSDSIPEPSFILGFLSLGTWALFRKLKSLSKLALKNQSM
ncbi:MAG: PEP-CTERM sorting domain-containing protein [Stigonema ocellatum SAG 48.90 = DSM 106950]|nr:PEP-CTERM sorting domain-containing protein [Stigonema ocellatum SAG 48.90 = DSM 106950]